MYMIIVKITKQIMSVSKKAMASWYLSASHSSTQSPFFTNSVKNERIKKLFRKNPPLQDKSGALL